MGEKLGLEKHQRNTEYRTPNTEFQSGALRLAMQALKAGGSAALFRCSVFDVFFKKIP